MNKRYQLAVIGSGSGGREAALLAARNGLRVGLIEKDTLGGTCLHRGCYSVRALRACAEVAEMTSKSSRFGFSITDSEPGLPAWISAQRRVSARLTHELKNQLEKAGVEILFGQGSLFETDQIRLTPSRAEEEIVEADYIILATGSRPEFDANARGPKFLNSDQLLTKTEFPRHLLIIGGGYIGCEFASIFRALGSMVTLVEKQSRLLPDWDADASAHLLQRLRESGVNVVLGEEVNVERVPHNLGTPLQMEVGDLTINPDLLLIATGRLPNVEN